MSHSTTPTIPHVVVRQKSASPVKVIRYSPYRFTKKGGSSSLQSLGHPHAHVSPLSPVYKLPVIPRGLTSSQGDEFFGTRHVQLGFDLLHHGEPQTPSKAQAHIILDLFLTAYKLSFAPPFLIVVCKHLTPRPWPVTVASMPLFLTDDENAKPMEIGLTSQGQKVTIQTPIHLWQTPSMAVFKEIYGILDTFSKGKGFRRLQWTGGSFVAVASQEPFVDWRKRLPSMVNSRLINYVFDVKPWMEKAARNIIPQGRTRDDSAYNQLRPGIMVSSMAATPSNDLFTTSGIYLKSPNTPKQYIAVASQGFPGGVEDEVMHPNRNGLRVARVSKVFGESDIALAELSIQNHNAYSNMTFSTPQDPVLPFRDLVSFQQLRIGDNICMDTAFNGRCEGSLVRVDVLRIPPSDEPTNRECEYEIGSFGYFGHGMDLLWDGSCGAPLWNDDYDVIGQFGFAHAINIGLCYCPSYSMLKDLGYTIAPTTMQ